MTPLQRAVLASGVLAIAVAWMSDPERVQPTVTGSPFSQQVGTNSAPPVPTTAGEDAPDQKRFEVALLSLGPGVALLSRWGHSALWIRDTWTDAEATYNYGLSAPQGGGGMGRDLALGRALVGTAKRPPLALIESYAVENRDVRVLHLNLSDAQASLLYRLVEADVADTTHTTVNDVFADNCTTRIRDRLDLVLGGELRAATSSIDVGRITFRSEALNMAGDDWLLRGALTLSMGRSVDRPLAPWDAVFLPESLAAVLSRVRVRQPSGELAPLVMSQEALYLADNRGDEGGGFDWHPLIVVGTLLPLIVYRAARARGTAHGRAIVLRIVGGLPMLGFGSVGIALAGLWLGGHQVSASSNANLFHLHPGSLVVGWWILTMSFASVRDVAIGLGMLSSLAAVSVCGVLLNAASTGPQANFPVVVATVPTYFALLLGLWTHDLRLRGAASGVYENMPRPSA